MTTCPGCGSRLAAVDGCEHCEFPNLVSGRYHYCGANSCYCKGLRRTHKQAALNVFAAAYAEAERAGLSPNSSLDLPAQQAVIRRHLAEAGIGTGGALPGGDQPAGWDDTCTICDARIPVGQLFVTPGGNSMCIPCAEDGGD